MLMSGLTLDGKGITGLTQDGRGITGLADDDWLKVKDAEAPSQQSGANNAFLYSAMVLGIGAGISNAITDYGNAKAKSGSLRTQAAASEGNAELAELQAQNALYQGMQQIGEITRKAGAAKASARTAMAARGVGLGSGTAASVLASSDVNKELDMIAAKRNAIQAAAGYRRQAGNLRTQAKVSRIMASAADSSARSSAIGSLISTAGQVAGMWYMGTK